MAPLVNPQWAELLRSVGVAWNGLDNIGPFSAPIILPRQ